MSRLNKILLAFSLALLFPALSSAQNFTSVTATIVDPNGVPYSYAQVSAQLVPTGTNPTIGGVGISGFTRATADVTGAFNMTLGSNAVISPAASQWQFTVTETGISPPAGTGPQSFVVTLTISGAAQNISTNLNAVAPKLSNTVGGSNPSPSTNNISVAKNCSGVAICYTVADDVRIVSDATWTSGVSTVTISGTDPPFLSPGSIYPATCSTPSATCDVGKVMFGTYNCVAVNPQQCNAAIPQGTITAITSATVATISTVPTQSSSAGTGHTYFAWGTDDTTPLQQANDAAMTALIPTSITLPCGQMFFGSDLFNTTRTGGRARYQIGIKGCVGNGATELVPLPKFTCAHINGCFVDLTYAAGQLFQAGLTDEMDDVMFFGLGLDVPPSGFLTGTSYVLASFSNAGIVARNVQVMGYLWNRPSADTDYGFQCIGCEADNVWGFVAGNRSCHFTSSYFGQIGHINYGYCGGSEYTACTVDGSIAGSVLTTVSTVCGYPNFTDSTVLSATVNVPAGAVLLWNDYHGLWTGKNFFSGGTTTLNGTVEEFTCCGGATSITVNNSAATVIFNGFYLPTGGFPWLTLSAGTIYDVYPNIGIATAGTPAIVTGGNYIAKGHSVNGACTGVATASSTLGLYGTGPNVTATNCTSAAIGSGIPIDTPGTLQFLLVTASAGGVNGSSGAVTVYKNGVATSMTCTLGTTTLCQDRSHPTAVAAGDLISIQFTTQAADTLAGVKALVPID